MRFKVIVVSPRYQINLGYIARVSKNFGVQRLFLVKPRVKIGQSAIMFSKHARDLLLKAKIYKDLDSAVKDCDIVVGTTGIWKKANISFKRIYDLEEAVTKLSKMKGNKTAAILIGRDDTGLTKDEIERCDMVVYIPTNQEYPVLNISHALGIILYALTSKRFKPVMGEMPDRRVDKKEMEYLFKAFDNLIANKKIRNKRAVKGIFRRLVYLSQPNRQEVHALISAVK